MSQQYISILICGNQSTNAGWSDLAIFNSATFTLADGVFNGFDHLDNIYTVRIESSKVKGLNGIVDINQVIYTMVKNKVRSAGASRDGRMKIGFSIPKGYRLPDGVTPMQVMDDIESAFIKNCMTGPDPITGVCYFNSGTLNTSAINEIGLKYPLVPAQTPFRQMNPVGEVAFVETGSATGIGQVLNDVQYPEFQPFKEVIIAESSQGSSYRRIDGLKIPRRATYEVLERTKNGIKLTGFKPTGIKVSDPNEVITISPSALAPIHHHYDPVCFTLATANDIPEVMIDRANETVEVTFSPIPNTKTYTVELDANDTAKEYLKDNGPLRLINSQTGKLLQMSADKKQLTLKGDENFCFDNNTIAIELPEKSGYKFIAKSIQCIPGLNIVKCTLNILKTRPTKPITDKEPSPATTTQSNLTEIRIHAAASLLPRKRDMLRISIGSKDEDFAIYQLTKQMASEVTDGGYTWTILVPTTQIIGRYARISARSWEYIPDFKPKQPKEKNMPINIEIGNVRKKNAIIRFFSSYLEELFIVLLTLALGLFCYLYFTQPDAPQAVPADTPEAPTQGEDNPESTPTFGDIIKNEHSIIQKIEFNKLGNHIDQFLKSNTLTKEDSLNLNVLNAYKALAEIFVQENKKDSLISKFIESEEFNSLPDNIKQALQTDSILSYGCKTLSDITATAHKK